MAHDRQSWPVREAVAAFRHTRGDYAIISGMEKLATDRTEKNVRMNVKGVRLLIGVVAAALWAVVPVWAASSFQLEGATGGTVTLDGKGGFAFSAGGKTLAFAPRSGRAHV